tara:strand:+ start:102396 stop:102674 length:279 start_codon:yes stop_codon:yes gene_type:complete
MDINASKKHVEEMCLSIATEYGVKLNMEWNTHVSNDEWSDEQTSHTLSVSDIYKTTMEKQIRFVEPQLLDCDNKVSKLRIVRDIVQLCEDVK